ncbi:hypothetical protein ACHAWF_003510, partial [Thalassiosira exigua]
LIAWPCLRFQYARRSLTEIHTHFLDIWAGRRRTTQYVTKASSTVRAALKEPAKSKAMAQEAFAYNRSHWTGGTQGEKTMVEALKQVGK